VFYSQIPENPGGAVIELTGTSPKIHFGPVLAPTCSIFLDVLTSRLQSTCDISTPSNNGRRLQGGEVTFDHGVSQKELETLKAQQRELKEEVAELRKMLTTLTK